MELVKIEVVEPFDGHGGGYVYVLEVDGCVKIGMTRNIKSREKSLRSFIYKYLHKKTHRFWHSKKHLNYAKNEKLLHRLFLDKKHFGSEFFDMTFDDVISKINEVIFIRKETKAEYELKKEEMNRVFAMISKGETVNNSATCSFNENIIMLELHKATIICRKIVELLKEDKTSDCYFNLLKEVHFETIMRVKSYLEIFPINEDLKEQILDIIEQTLASETL